MIPLFKSHYSIGKSILTLKRPDLSLEGSADSIFDIAKKEKLNQIVLVEDSLTGFLEAAKISEEIGVQLIFGLRLTAGEKRKRDKAEVPKTSHRIVVFAKNADGCRLLNKIYSEAFLRSEGEIAMDDLKDLWNEEALKLAIPFYDSFIFKNTMSLSSCAPVFNFTSPTFFIEDNELPFDSLIKGRVIKFCKTKGFKTENVKTIYYKNRKDFAAYQTYKCICNRGGWSGKAVSLEKPNLDHCGSREFSFESWRSHNES
jgi:DNA polymerase III alpha subunit